MFVRLKIYFLQLAFDIARRIFGMDAPPAPGVSAIIAKKGKILVIDLSYRDGFSLPGGVLKGKEDFIEGLKREIKEETGLLVKSHEYLNTYSSRSSVGGFPKVNVTYTAKVKGNPRESEEGKPMWIDPKKALRQMVYEDNINAVRDYLKRKR